MDLQTVTKTLGVAGTTGGLVSDQTISSIRSIVLMVGGSLVTEGVITDDSLSKYSGIAISVATILYLLYRNYRTHQKFIAAAQLNTNLSEKQVTQKLNTGELVIPPKPTK